MSIEPLDSAQQTGPAFEARFARLAQAWRDQRGPSSSVSRLVLHPAYQRIIGLGPAAIPLLLRELQREPDHWFWALRSITGEDPVPESHAGELIAMARDWIEWGISKGHIDDRSSYSALPKAG